MLFLGKHSYNDECVKVNSLTQHPKVITPEQVKMDKLRNFTAGLMWERKKEKKSVVNMFHYNEYIQFRSNEQDDKGTT